MVVVDYYQFMLEGGDRMYSVQEAQAIDYLLKSIVLERASVLHNKNLKLVVDLNGILWYGDFVKVYRDDDSVTVDKNFVCQSDIDDAGHMEMKYDSMSSDDAHPFFGAVWKLYSGDIAQHRRTRLQNTDLSFLFHYLTNIVTNLVLPTKSSPLFPHFLHATSLDGKLRLPFIHLTEGNRIKVISITETNS